LVAVVAARLAVFVAWERKVATLGISIFFITNTRPASTVHVFS
jgi:hypothetical protein